LKEEIELVENVLSVLSRAIFNYKKLSEGIQTLNFYGSSYCGLALRGNSDLDMTIIVDDLLVN